MKHLDTPQMGNGEDPGVCLIVVHLQGVQLFHLYAESLQ